MGLEPAATSMPAHAEQFRFALIGQTAGHKLRSLRGVARAIHDPAGCALRKTKTFNF
jgi:hypothetical protein